MRIGYARFGRTMVLNSEKWAAVGGDDEPPLLLMDLARRNPQHTFVIVSRNPGENPQKCGFPDNVENPWENLQDAWRQVARDVTDASDVVRRMHDLTAPIITNCDHHIAWAGQHGTSNTPIPQVGDRSALTNPQASFIRYCGYLITGYNEWREKDPHTREEIWLHPDPRNYNKARDLKWPPIRPMLGQYTYSRNQSHERYGDKRDPKLLNFNHAWWSDEVNEAVWSAQHDYVYARLELAGVRPDDMEFDNEWMRPGHFGLLINETRSYVAMSRLSVMKDWVLPMNPYFVYGAWTDESLKRLGVDIRSISMSQRYSILNKVRTTFTTPSSGGGWATVKPWQAFAAGTVCFFHPKYDDQGHILPLREKRENSDRMNFLVKNLRVSTPTDLQLGIQRMNQDRVLWQEIVDCQRRYYEHAVKQQRIHQLIEGRLV